jgi:hypothetical protein
MISRHDVVYLNVHAESNFNLFADSELGQRCGGGCSSMTGLDADNAQDQ